MIQKKILCIDSCRYHSQCSLYFCVKKYLHLLSFSQCLKNFIRYILQESSALRFCVSGKSLLSFCLREILLLENSKLAIFVFFQYFEDDFLLALLLITNLSSCLYFYSCSMSLSFRLLLFFSVILVFSNLSMIRFAFVFFIFIFLWSLLNFLDMCIFSLSKFGKYCVLFTYIFFNVSAFLLPKFIGNFNYTHIRFLEVVLQITDALRSFL